MFWEICSTVVEDLTAVNDCHHCPGLEETGEVVVNIAVQIPAPFLYQKCKTETLLSLSEEKILHIMVQIPILTKRY